MAESDYLTGFLSRVKDWMRSSGLEGEPVSLSAKNDEWVGSTEEGFRDELRVTLTYRIDGREHSKDLDAAQQESLWRHVIPTRLG